MIENLAKSKKLSKGRKFAKTNRLKQLFFFSFEANSMLFKKDVLD